MSLTTLKFAFFFTIVFVILFGGHYFVYRSLTDVFIIERVLFKFGLAVFIIVMPVGFLAVLLLGHTNHNIAIKALYIVCSAWLGIAANLLLASCFIWVFSRLMSLAQKDFNLMFFGTEAFLLSLIFSFYGFWNAFNTEIKIIEVPIKNLPSNWQGKTIVQLSDMHLGRIYGVNFLRRIVKQANAQNPDLILITGDLFDGADGELDVFTEQLNGLRASYGVFFVTGNHESYVGKRNALKILHRTNIKILSNEIVDLDGIQLVGLDYLYLNDLIGLTGQTDKERKTIDSLPGFDKNKPNILMYHAPTNIKQALDAGIDFQLSGHAHRGQLWLSDFFNFIVYGRYDYGLHFIGDFSIYTTSGIGTWGPPMRTGKKSEIPVFKLRIK